MIPVLHGTSVIAATGIIESGFSALSSVDAGFYGKGMYFSSSALYTTPYYASKADPAILICLAIPGNPYPVVEPRNDPNSFLGAPISSGYQSNYVLCTKDGNPCERIMANGLYDELVLDQEAQVVPVVLVQLDQSKLIGLTAKFQRETFFNILK